jgi:hypothetical protein
MAVEQDGASSKSKASLHQAVDARTCVSCGLATSFTYNKVTISAYEAVEACNVVRRRSSRIA